MKRRLLALFVSIMILVPIFAIPASAYSNNDYPNYPNGVQLYVAGGYAAYSVSDLQTLWACSHEFIITSGGMRYNHYDLGTGSDHEIVSQQDINNIQKSQIENQTDSGLAYVKSSLQTVYDGILANLTLDGLVTAVAQLVDNLITASGESSDLAIWLPIPAVDFKTLADNFEAPYKLYMDKLKDAITVTDFNTYIRGFVWTSEAVVTVYTPFNFNSPSTNFGNQLVDLMDAIGDKADAMGKEFMWLPYRDTTDNGNYKRTGYVLNKTNIFDYACIQPRYYFDSQAVNGLYSVRNSARDNVVYDYNGNVYGGTKTSSTKIGVVMEIDYKVTQSEYNDRYWAYTQVYSPYKTSVPIVFYAGDPASTLNGTVRHYLGEFLIHD